MSIENNSVLDGLHIEAGDFEGLGGFARLLAWADVLAGSFQKTLGVRLEVVIDASASRATRAEVTWVRDARARKKAARMMPEKKPKRFSPLTYGHASLTVRVFDTGVEVALEVPPHAVLDRAALRWRLEQPEEKLLLLGQIVTLPRNVTAPALGHREASTLSADDLEEWVRDPDASLVLAAWIEKDRAIADPTLVERQVRGLAHVYKLLAWDEKMSLPRGAFSVKKTPEKKRRPRRSERARSRRDRVGAGEEDAPPSIREPPSRPEGASALDVQANGAFQRLRVDATIRLVDIDPALAVEKGMRVYVLAGPFVGKTGVVRELDTQKGIAKVMFGIFGADVRVADLAATKDRVGPKKKANGRGARRPLLASSHRRSPTAPPKR